MLAKHGVDDHQMTVPRSDSQVRQDGVQLAAGDVVGHDDEIRLPVVPAVLQQPGRLMERETGFETAPQPWRAALYQLSYSRADASLPTGRRWLRTGRPRLRIWPTAALAPTLRMTGERCRARRAR